MNRSQNSSPIRPAPVPPNAPRVIRLSTRMIVLCVLFTLFAVIIGYGMWVVLSQPITIEDDIPMPVIFKVFMIAVGLVVETGILFMVIPLWLRIVKSGAMTLTPAGIENTFMLFSVLAFWTILRIRFIPWSALTFDEWDDSGCRVDVRQLPPGSTGRLAKLLLRITGFYFQIGRISREELEHYRQASLPPS